MASGAKCIVEQGVLDGVDAGLRPAYLFPGGPLARSPLSEGTLHPAADYFKLTVTGKASHGALPDEGIDATVAASAIVLALQTISSREFSPLDPIVVTVGTLHSGARFNIISGEAVLEGTVRIFNKDIHPHMPEIMERIAKQTGRGLPLHSGARLPVQDRDPGQRAAYDGHRRAAARKAGAAREDIPLSAQHGRRGLCRVHVPPPRAFVALGGGGDAPQHSDMFCIDESAMETGSALYAQVAVDYLNS